MNIWISLIVLFITIAHAAPDYYKELTTEFKQKKTTGQVRRFFITAEESIWDYASECASKENVPENNIIGTRYYKALYHEYEDVSYTKKKKKFHWEGSMGPILRAEVGDVIQVFFWNRASRNFTMHPHGVFYEFEMEGAVFKGSYEESMILPNQNYTYTWNVLPRSGPGPKDGNSIVWGYHSHVTENDIFAGLYGSIVVYRPGTLSNDDIVSSVFVSDENLSPYLSQTMSELYVGFNSSKYNDDEIYRASQFHSINGLVSSSPKDLIVRQKTVNWHLLGWGTYWDVKYIKWKMSSINWNDKSVDYIRLMPASFYTATVTSKKNGTMSFGSLDNEEDGMVMSYTVL